MHLKEGKKIHMF